MKYIISLLLVLIIFSCENPEMGGLGVPNLANVDKTKGTALNDSSFTLPLSHRIVTEYLEKTGNFDNEIINDSIIPIKVSYAFSTEVLANGKYASVSVLEFPKTNILQNCRFVSLAVTSYKDVAILSKIHNEIGDNYATNYSFIKEDTENAYSVHTSNSKPNESDLVNENAAIIAYNIYSQNVNKSDDYKSRIILTLSENNDSLLTLARDFSYKKVFTTFIVSGLVTYEFIEKIFSITGATAIDESIVSNLDERDIDALLNPQISSFTNLNNAIVADKSSSIFDYYLNEKSAYRYLGATVISRSNTDNLTNSLKVEVDVNSMYDYNISKEEHDISSQINLNSVEQIDNISTYNKKAGALLLLSNIEPVIIYCDSLENSGNSALSKQSLEKGIEHIQNYSFSVNDIILKDNIKYFSSKLE